MPFRDILGLPVSGFHTVGSPEWLQCTRRQEGRPAWFCGPPDLHASLDKAHLIPHVLCTGTPDSCSPLVGTHVTLCVLNWGAPDYDAP